MWSLCPEAAAAGGAAGPPPAAGAAPRLLPTRSDGNDVDDVAAGASPLSPWLAAADVASTFVCCGSVPASAGASVGVAVHWLTLLSHTHMLSSTMNSAVMASTRKARCAAQNSITAATCSFICSATVSGTAASIAGMHVGAVNVFRVVVYVIGPAAAWPLLLAAAAGPRATSMTNNVSWPP